MFKIENNIPKPITLREFKFQRRAQFLKDLYSEINTLYVTFSKMVEKKGTGLNYEKECIKFKDSQDELDHYYSRFNNIILKDSEINKHVFNIVASAQYLNDIMEKMEIKSDIEEIKNEFRDNSKGLISNFKDLSYRLNDCGVMMWI